VVGNALYTKNLPFALAVRALISRVTDCDNKQARRCFQGRSDRSPEADSSTSSPFFSFTVARIACTAPEYLSKDVYWFDQKYTLLPKHRSY